MLSAVLPALAQLAPTLKEAELRILLHLTATAAASGSLTVQASARELETATRTARSVIQLALDALSHARPDRDAPRVHQAEARAESIGANSRASSEDVRAWAITVYIEVTGGSHSRKR